MSPESVPFDPGSRKLPDALGPALADPERHLLLVVATDAGDTTVRTAVGLAEARGAAGYPTVLADAAFDDPRLHQFLDTSNLEGLADVFEFGASVRRALIRPRDRPIEFIPSGPYVPDPTTVLGNPRWARIADEMATEGKTMLVFVLPTTPGVDALSRQVGQAIIVGAGDEDAAAAALDPACRLAAVVRPAPEESAGRDLSEPLVFGPDTSGTRRRPPVRWVVLVIVLAILGWAGYGLVVSPGGGEPVVEAPPPPTEPEPDPEPVETPIEYSVAVEAHQDLDIAEDRVARLQRQEPGVVFYLAPVPIRGSVWYRVLAGPVATQEEGLQLMDRLVDEGLKSDYDAWAVRPTQYTFLLGEYETSADAGNRVVVLAQQDIPAYIVSIRYEPGSPRFRVYGGAFETENAAAVMRNMLQQAGIDAPLIKRVGEPVAVGS